MFAIQLRAAVEAAPRDRLSELSGALWKAFSAGAATEAQAEELSNLIEARKAVAARRVGSRPHTGASMERRRRWAVSGRLPPAIAARFTVAELAVLAVVTVEAGKRGDCRLTIDHIAALAGVGRSSVKAAIRQARALGLVTVEERRVSRWRNESNVVRIVSREWLAWMRLARHPRPQGGGVKSATPTNTDLQDKSRKRPSEPSKEAAGGQGRARTPASQASGTGPSRRAGAMS
jgi:hypothetical protein